MCGVCAPRRRPSAIPAVNTSASLIPGAVRFQHRLGHRVTDCRDVPDQRQFLLGVAYHPAQQAEPAPA